MSYTLAKLISDLIDLGPEAEHQDVIVVTPAGRFLVRGAQPGERHDTEINAVAFKEPH